MPSAHTTVVAPRAGDSGNHIIIQDPVAFYRDLITAYQLYGLPNLPPNPPPALVAQLLVMLEANNDNLQ